MIRGIHIVIAAVKVTNANCLLMMVAIMMINDYDYIHANTFLGREILHQQNGVRTIFDHLDPFSAKVMRMVMRKTIMTMMRGEVDNCGR